MSEKVRTVEDKFKEFLNSNAQSIFVYVIVLALIIFFREDIIAKVVCYLKDSKSLKTISILDKAAFVIPFVLASLWIIIKKITGYVFSLKRFWIYTYFILIYCIFRLTVAFPENLRITDSCIIILPDLLVLVYAILAWANVRNIVELFEVKEEKTTLNSGFRIEKPLESNEDELLGYGDYSQKLIAKIKETKSLQKSFAIGINGAWGIGKSSFLNIVKEGLEEEEYIHIHFRPWEAENSSQIIVHFVQELKNTLKAHHADLDSLLDDYLFNFIDNQDQWYFKIVRTFKKNKTVEDTKKAIEQAIIDTNKKLVVYIDDVDRLQGEEVVEVLKLIRGNANFKNTFYLVAYDRLFVEEAISQNIIAYNSSQFLEKIFNVEISLPYYRPHMLLNLFEKQIETLDIKNKHLQVSLENYIDLLKKEEEKNSYLFLYIIRSPRDVIRIVNSLLINYNNELHKDVNIEQFLLLEILRLKNQCRLVKVIYSFL